jgi:hypothetical protein
MLRRQCCFAYALALVFLFGAASPGFSQVPDKKNDAASPSAFPSDISSDTNARSVSDEIKATNMKNPPGGNRVFGVLPNYRTVDAAQVTGPLTAGEKFTIASKDSFDYPLVLLAGALAGIGQWTNQNPSFGQGLQGYSKRLVAGYADQALGNLMTEGIFPATLHEDPRFYRRATGTTTSRVLYAATRIFVTHTDAGRLRFNYSEWVGNATSVGISNAYYPDGRTVQANVTKLVEQCGIDSLSQVLKEFWPDIHQKFFTHKPAANSAIH